jgi:putative addiction module component (TIGR02574 family)
MDCGEMKVEEILTAALDLPEAERLYLAERLLASLPPVPGILSLDDPELYAELDRRSKDFKDAVRAEDLWQDG